jgi:hypothetical protein
MTDQTQQVNEGASQYEGDPTGGLSESEVQEAQLQGWRGPEEFHGDPANFVDAKTYLDKSRQIQPILRENNKRLVEQNKALQTQVNQLVANQKEMAESMEAFKEFQAEQAADKAVRMRAKILAELRDAKEQGDLDGEVEAQSKLSKFDNAAVTPPARKTPETPVQPQLDPSFVAWQSANPWFEADPVKRGLAIGMAQQLRQEGSSLVGAAFFAEVDKRMEQYGAPAKRGVSKVDAGGQGGQPRGSAASGYADLPADARAQCDADASRFVGPNKLYKTKAEWNKAFADLYFAE